MREPQLHAYNITIWVDSVLNPEQIREAVEQIELPGMQISVHEVIHA